jgi:hypothetical protein
MLFLGPREAGARHVSHARHRAKPFLELRGSEANLARNTDRCEGTCNAARSSFKNLSIQFQKIDTTTIPSN